MEALSLSQMATLYAGNFWHDAANVGCAAWGVGRFFFGITISVAGSPLAGATLTAIVDGACVTLATVDAVDLLV